QAQRFYGNILAAGAGAAVDPDRWDDLAQRREVAPKTYIGLGFDGSISRDATVLRACTVDGYRFTIKVWQRPTGDALRAWFRANPGADDWRVDRLDVAAVLDETFETYRVGRMLCDPPKWYTEIGTWQAKYGDDADGK